MYSVPLGETAIEVTGRVFNKHNEVMYAAITGAVKVF
jgi:hypothetical protein